MSPKVWSTFSSGGTKLRILDAPADRVDEAINFYIDHYLTEEPITKASGIPKNAEAIAEYRSFITQELKNVTQLNVMLCGIDNGDDKMGDIIGVSLSSLTTADQPFDMKITPKTNEVQKLFEMWGNLMTKYDIFKEQNVNKSIDCMGMIVHPKDSGLGIAEEFLKARRLLCKEKGAEVTSAWLSSIEPQKAAEREGYETVYEISFEELGKQAGVTFENVPKMCKLMMAKPL